MLRHFFDVPGDQFVPTPNNNKGNKKSQKPVNHTGLEPLEERKLLSASFSQSTDNLVDPQATVVNLHAEQDEAPQQNEIQQDDSDIIINVDEEDYTVEISAVTLPEVAVIGQTTKGSVSVTITNDTNEESSKSDRVNINVYARLVDAEDDSEDVLVGSKLNQTMNIGLEKSRTYKVNVEVSEELEEGEYIFVAIATTTEDEAVGTVESEETLDVQEAFVNLTGTIDDSKIPTEVIEGADARITLSVGVTNEGNVSLEKGQKIAITIVARPADAVDDSGDVVMVVLENQNVSGLKAGATKNINARFYLPADIEVDDYNFVAIIDSEDVVEESDEEDNEAAGESNLEIVESTIDLSATLDESKLPEALISGNGNKISLPITITNNGNTALDKAQTVSITIVARPADALDDSDDVEIVVFEEQKVGGLKPDQTKKINASFELPLGLESDDYVLVAIIDSGEDLDESDEDNNEAVGEVEIAVTEGVVNLNATLNESKVPNALISGNGDKITLPVTLTNDGNIALEKNQTVNITIVARPADALDSDDDVEIIVLADQKVGGLKPDQIKTINATFELPLGLESDDYVLVAIIDSDDDVEESDEEDNEAVGQTEIAVTEGVVNLNATLDESKVPAALLSGDGDKISLPVTITNDGNIALTSDQTVSITIVARPADALDSDDDIELLVLADQNVGGLKPDQSKTFKTSFELPAGMEADDYVLVAIIDSGDDLDESDEDDNEAVGTTEIAVTLGLPNLSATLDDSKFQDALISGAGDKISVPITILNDGNIALAKGQTIDITIVARPADAIDDSDDVEIVVLANQNVSGLGVDKTKKINASVTLPVGLESDDYILVAIIDSDNDVEEESELDNEAESDASIEVTEGTVNLTATLDESGIPESIIAGQTSSLSIPITITNDGNLNLAKGQKVTIVYVARPVEAEDDSDDILLSVLENQSLSSLKAGASKTIKANVELPADFEAADYNIVAIIDDEQQVDESDENDNEVVSEAVLEVVAPFVNLVATIDETNIPETALGGDNVFKVAITVTNEGNVAIEKGQKIDINLFVNDTQDTLDMVGIGDLLDANITGLKPGASKTFNVTVTIPEGVATSTYEIVAIVDTEDVVEESDEDDNIATSEATVDVTEGVRDLSLELDDSSIPEEAVSGSNTTFTLPVTITNDGNLSLAQGQKVQIIVTAYKVPEIGGVGINVPDEGIVVLTVDNVNLSNLQPDASKVVNLSFTLPLDDAFEDGEDYYFVVSIDSEDVLEESAEENNEAATEALVTVTRGGPNLSADIDETDIPEEAFSGDGTTIVVPVTITNDGVTAMANGQLVDIDIYIVDSEEEGEPVLLTTLEDQDISNLAVDATKTFLANVTLPGSIEDGSYKLIAIVDPENNIVEADEDDNMDLATGTIDITQGSLDFSVEITEESLEDFVVDTEGTATVTVTIVNEGNLSTAADATTQVALFARLADAEDDSNDVYLGQAESVDVGALAPDGSVEVTFTDVDLSGLEIGEYILVAIVNDAGNVNSESENSETQTIGSFIVAAESNDLALTLTNTAAADMVEGENGEGNSMTVVLTNNGSTTIPDETSVAIAIFARPVGGGEDIFITVNEEADVSALAPEGSAEFAFGELDLSALTPGEYNLVAVVYDEELGLSSELNNEAEVETSFTVAEVNQDIALSRVTEEVDSFTEGATGEANTITVRFTNNGNTAIPAETSVTVNVYAVSVFDDEVRVLVAEDLEFDISDLGVGLFSDELIDGLDLSGLFADSYILSVVVDDSALAEADDSNNQADAGLGFTVSVP